MLFNSYIFIFAFLPFTFFVYFYLNSLTSKVAAKVFLVFASLFFYSWWNPIYLPLILSSMFFNYTVGLSLSKESIHKIINKKVLLSLGIIANVTLLGYFKYADFFISNLNYLLDTDVGLLKLALPLAISFFTFQQIAYLVDSYRGETKEYSFLNYANFVTFFPQLIAGPIVHHSEMMPQFASSSNKLKYYPHIAMGLFIFSIGLFKKIIIADTFAVWATAGFDHAPQLHMVEAWVTSLSYTFQLYFDFSGYTDMAIGAALLFNIKLPLNFNSPYKASSIQDFWRRWHMTLSRFLKEYIYIPLGGNKKGEIRTYIALMATFLIGGIWHGAGWTFLFWGFLHGMAIVIHRAWSKVGFRLHTVLAWFITFNFINITWVFFRAKEWDDAMKVLSGMFSGALVLPSEWKEILYSLLGDSVYYGYWLHSISTDTYTMYWMMAGLFIVLALKNTNELAQKFKPNLWTMFYASAMFLIAALSLSKLSEFLYFNF
ncbi:MAG TPA: MBOAT family protein [Campylobacterales bacterium]|nr:MBOAT family protein [Campylobacterales bacterium]